MSVSDLVAFNQLADPDRIEVGQILRLDAATPPPAPSDGTSAAARFHWGDPIREWSDEFAYTGRPDPRSGSSRRPRAGRAMPATVTGGPRTPPWPTA